MRPLAGAGLAVLLCLQSAAAGAEERQEALAADPALPASAILALRGGESDPTQLRLVFNRTREGAAQRPLTAWIGADYSAVVDGGRLTITDLKLRRRFVVDQQAGTLVNLSLYGDVMFRRIELARRLKIGAALSAKGGAAALPQSLLQFWIESELGIAAPGTPADAIATRPAGGRTQFLHLGQDVAAVALSGVAVPAGLGHSYGAFLRRNLPLHPGIARWLADSGRVPGELAFTSEARGGTDRDVLRLASAATVTAGFPLPPRMRPVLLPAGAGDPDVMLLHAVLPHVFAAMRLRAADSAGEIARSRAAVARDLAGGRMFAAALGLTELALRWGRSATACIPGPDGACRKKADIERLLGADPRALAMFRAAALQDREPATALAIWRGLDRHDIVNGYVVDVFLARLLSESGDRAAAARSFAAAFAGDPGLILLYRELGDHFARASRLDLAWLCYDLGRTLPNRDYPDALADIDTLEQDLAAAYPEMF